MVPRFCSRAINALGRLTRAPRCREVPDRSSGKSTFDSNGTPRERARNGDLIHPATGGAFFDGSLPWPRIGDMRYSGDGRTNDGKRTSTSR
jgi:hypothetical protein